MKSILRYCALTGCGPSLAAILMLSALPSCRGQGLPVVPPVFQDLYNTLNGDLSDFNNAIKGLWNGSKYPVLYTGELTNANSNNGPQLLNGMRSVLNDLTMLKALGAQAVAVEISFPMLYEPFFSSQTEYEQYVSFYAQVAAAVRAQGFKLVVESQSMMPSGLGSGWGPQVAAFYPTLSWTQYQAARAQAAKVVAETMQPDYFVLQEEPDTEAAQSGQTNVDTVAGSISMLDQSASSVLAAGVPNMKIGAGVGSWLTGFQGFIAGFSDQQCSATQPCVTVPLDFIDMHIFPINELGPPTNDNFWRNALTIVSMAATAGKPVTLSQTWLRKVRNSEWGVLSGDVQESREVFGFWDPEDSAFLQTIVNLANYSKMIFMNPFDTEELSAYLTYSVSLADLSPSQLFSQEVSQSALVMQQGIYSSTGMSYYSSIVSPPDTISPSTPTGLTAIAVSPTAVNVTWNASTDNVGVAGYYISRNGVPLPTTALTQFQDTGLTGYTTYTYQVEAYDLAFNVSQPAVVAVKTPNSAPPNPPTRLAGTAVSTQQIDLTWSASTGTVIPTSYLVFRGTSPSSMTQIQQLNGTATSFDNYSLTPRTTYYYGVEAVAGGLSSGMSNVIAVTTLALPSAPSNPKATASSSTQVKLTWSASTGGLPISGYDIYRGTSPSSLSQISATKNTSYTDNTVNSRTTYYYGVQAIDTLGNLSPMSAIVPVTTP
jgi:fibronectin type 3 domain-containing protein